MMPTLMVAVTGLSSGPVAAICRVRMLYGANSGLPDRVLTTLASTIGNFGPAQRGASAGTPSTSKALPVTWFRYGRP